MAKKNRSTLKRFFSEGALPTEEQFSDLIDSSLNVVDEGFDKSPEHGFEISAMGDHERMLSFFRNSASQYPAWSISYEKDRDRLVFNKVSHDNNAKPVVTLSSEGRVGIDNDKPECTLDVGGFISAYGRIGANSDDQKTILADGEWHDITEVLSGCHGLEVMAGVGSPRTGKYALMNAVALNTFNPHGWLSNFLNLKKRIRYQQAYYFSFTNKLKLRWHGKDRQYTLQMRTNCDYGGEIRVRYYLTRLWFAEDMRDSWIGKDGSDDSTHDA
ncbi:MAG: hypothetical protein L3J98_09175 [Gammaproteobacteria bacterium]|nr:hypothetical protein [Gammaproteobacteria bacterium]MCF6260313.1 hypothetical protein [Gammaproteobacteria bacterium]